MHKYINVAEAKAHLPELIDRAANGETIVIARSGKPRAKLVPLEQPKRKKRIPGKGKRRFQMLEGFDDALPPEVLALFEGRIGA